MDMNTCDKCKAKQQSSELVWITAEDFTPHNGEIVPEAAYQKYDALCEACYLNVINTKEV